MNRRISKILFVIALAVIFLTAMTVVAQKRGFGGRLAQPEADGNLDQCANGGVGDPAVPCTGAAWQNGNLNENQAHYLEGGSIPYRLVFSGMTIGSTNTVTIEWDTTVQSGGNHAIDYLTSFDRTETTADPCSGVPGCNLLVKDTETIPVDLNVTKGNDGIPGNGDDIIQIPGVFALYDGQILGVSAYTMTGDFTAASQTRVTITFRANSATPVLAWGGHIATRLDWGTAHSTITITGSPFHMRVLDINGSGGNQDRALSSGAALFPGQITIIKDARPHTSQVFGFVATGPGVSNFSLVDDGSSTANSALFANLTNFGSANAVTVTENAPTNNYFLMQIGCVEVAAGGSGQQNTTVNVPTRTANIILEEGESVTCTFLNAVPTAATAVVSGRVVDIYGGYAPNVIVSIMNLSTGVARSTRTNSFGIYQFAELPVGENYMITVSSRRYTFAFDSRTVTVMDDLTDQDFTAIPIN